MTFPAEVEDPEPVPELDPELEPDPDPELEEASQVFVAALRLYPEGHEELHEVVELGWKE